MKNTIGDIPAAAAPATTSDLMTREEAAGYLRRKTQALAYWAWRRPGYLKMVRVGRVPMYRKQDLEEFLNENTIVAPTDGCDA